MNPLLNITNTACSACGHCYPLFVETLYGTPTTEEEARKIHALDCSSGYRELLSRKEGS